MEHAETLSNAKHQLLQEIITEEEDEGRSESCSASARVMDVMLRHPRRRSDLLQRRRSQPAQHLHFDISCYRTTVLFDLYVNHVTFRLCAQC